MGVVHYAHSFSCQTKVYYYLIICDRTDLFFRMGMTLYNVSFIESTGTKEQGYV